MFIKWQQELISATSISKIALLFNTIERAIEWTQLRGQVTLKFSLEVVLGKQMQGLPQER